MVRKSTINLLMTHCYAKNQSLYPHSDAVRSHTVTWDTMKSAAQQWISTTSVYTFCLNISSPCGLWSPLGPSLHFGSPSVLGTSSPGFSVLVGSSSQTGSSSGRRKMKSSVWERVELLSRRVMIPLLNEGPLCYTYHCD